MENLSLLSQICSCVTAVAAALVLLIRPLREWVSGASRLREGQKCLLRSNMLRTYYRNRPQQSIRQYEYENFVCEYKAYKALRGNSFVDRIYREIQQWEVIT
ncbi:MAG: hypothetical protein IJT78_03910 [Oscillospiraceae bacterium]|nr:hypothetical protein [Oscillospiraceae bacterium]